jgi:hypothetical protein
LARVLPPDVRDLADELDSLVRVVRDRGWPRIADDAMTVAPPRSHERSRIPTLISG